MKKKVDFTFAELLRSDTAVKKGIENKPLYTQYYDNMLELILYVLQPIRDAYGKPVYISSGYRCPQLNKAVGGADNSYHLFGLAADINNGASENKKIFEWIAQHAKELPLKEYILGKNNAYVHVSLDRVKLNRLLGFG